MRMYNNGFFVLILLIMGCNPTQKSVHYESENLVIKQLTGNTFQHISFLSTEEWGKVPCNGMIVVDSGEAIIFDAPVENSVSVELINWVEKQLQCKINAVVATHFHSDCIGGLSAFHDRHIPSFAHSKTIELVKENGGTVPQNAVGNTSELSLGNEKVILDYLGEGHTQDNLVGYFPKNRTLFGGCLIKSIGAGKGNLEDANILEWPKTVTKLKAKYKDALIVIPGHGNPGGKELLDFTINLFAEK